MQVIRRRQRQAMRVAGRGTFMLLGFVVVALGTVELLWLTHGGLLTGLVPQ